MSPPTYHRLRECRLRKQWSQGDLALRAGISRAAVSAIEQRRLSPSVSAALSLARALGISVEELFDDREPAPVGNEDPWAWEATSSNCRYWRAEVGGARRLYPVEPTSLGEIPHDGVWNGKQANDLSPGVPEQVLVVATCDPAIGFLAAEYARQTPFRLLPLTRSSRDALGLLQVEKVHAAGVHLSSNKHSGGNATAVKQADGTDSRLLRIGVWQEGIAFANHLSLSSTQAAISGSRLKWVGREPGSGARQCLDELLTGRRPPRRVAPDHRSVALAIRCGWADAGVCLRLVSEEAGLSFLAVRREAYDLCFHARVESDPRLKALVDVVQSKRYRQLLGGLPGYEVQTTGDMTSC